MKRLIAALLFAAVALTLATPAISASNFVRYRLGAPIPLRAGVAAVWVDSTARNFNTALTGGSEDTSAVMGFPADFAWTAVTDSIPIMLVVSRIGGTGASTDSVQVVLDCNYGGSVVPISRTDANNGFGFSTVALVGTATSGVAVFKLGTASTQLLNAINTYSTVAKGWPAQGFRVICRSYSGAASAGRFSVALKYPTIN
jgi:hypothetical protein